MSVKMMLAAILTPLIFSGEVMAAPAMPFPTSPVETVIPVSSGCGLGVRRGPFDGCNAVYGGYYYRVQRRAYNHGYYDGYRVGYFDGYYDGSGGGLLVDQGACSGRHMYPVCNIYGRCWAACDWR